MGGEWWVVLKRGERETKKSRNWAETGQQRVVEALWCICTVMHHRQPGLGSNRKLGGNAQSGRRMQIGFTVRPLHSHPLN